MTNEEFNQQFRGRTFDFGIKIFQWIDTIPPSPAGNIIKYQLGKAASSIGANFRAFCRGRSKNERFAKICIVVEEADESVYWLEMLDGLSLGNIDQLRKLIKEGKEITAITTAIKHSSSRTH